MRRLRAVVLLVAAVYVEQRVAKPADQDEDAWRKPAEVLNVLDARPGMKVIDYFAGGGYYTELLARIVGPEGQVIAYNNESYAKYAADKPAKRYGNERLPNVAQLTAAPEDLPLEPASIDAALFVQSYHHLHWVSKDGSWPATDPKAAGQQVLDLARVWSGTTESLAGRRVLRIN